MPVVLALHRLRDNRKLEVSLHYIARLCLQQEELLRSFAHFKIQNTCFLVVGTFISRSLIWVTVVELSRKGRQKG